MIPHAPDPITAGLWAYRSLHKKDGRGRHDQLAENREHVHEALRRHVERKRRPSLLRRLAGVLREWSDRA